MVDKLLTPEDISKYLGFNINTVVYDDIPKYDDVNDMLVNDCCLILIRDTPLNNSYVSGHWVGITKDNDVITFFDSYGGEIDDQLKYVHPYFRPELTKLMIKHIKNGGTVEFNDFDFQKLKEGINTCGRHCAMWFKFHDKYDIDDYTNIFKFLKNKGINLDELSVILTK